ncbi:PREDICTED: At2g29880, partial [Prunus dulcis]
MVDAANYGWHDSNDLPSKQIVESKILPWDSISKKFTATEEVWQDYFKSHPSQVHLQRETFADYEDLVIAIGNGTTTGKNSIGLGDDTDARTYQVGESRPTRLQDTNEAFVPSQNETPYQTLSSGNFTSSPFLDTNLEAPLEKLSPRKKLKPSLKQILSSVETITRDELVEKIYMVMYSIAAITTEIRGLHSLMEKREKEREKTNNVWD